MKFTCSMSETIEQCSSELCPEDKNAIFIAVQQTMKLLKADQLLTPVGCEAQEEALHAVCDPIMARVFQERISAMFADLKMCQTSKAVLCVSREGRLSLELKAEVSVCGAMTMRSLWPRAVSECSIGSSFRVQHLVAEL